jgi:hypothetical protein
VRLTRSRTLEVNIVVRVVILLVLVAVDLELVRLHDFLVIADLPDTTDARVDAVLEQEPEGAAVGARADRVAFDVATDTGFFAVLLGECGGHEFDGGLLAFTGDLTVAAVPFESGAEHCGCSGGEEDEWVEQIEHFDEVMTCCVVFVAMKTARDEEAIGLRYDSFPGKNTEPFISRRLKRLDTQNTRNPRNQSSLHIMMSTRR